MATIPHGQIILLTKKGNYCSPSVVSVSINTTSSSVGPLIVSEGEELQLPHCSQLHLQLYVLCVVLLVHPNISRDAKSVNKMFLILCKYIWRVLLFVISLYWCFTLFYIGESINQSYGDLF